MSKIFLDIDRIVVFMPEFDSSDNLRALIQFELQHAIEQVGLTDQSADMSQTRILTQPLTASESSNPQSFAHALAHRIIQIIQPSH